MNTTFFKNSLVVTAILMVFAACSPKYTADFNNSNNYIAPEETEDKSQVNTVADMSTEDVSTLERVTLKDANFEDSKADELYVSKEKKLKPYVIPEVEELVKKYEEKAKKIESSSLSKKEVRQTLRKEKKHLRKNIKREVKEEVKALKKAGASDDYVLMMVLSVLIPPLGVGLTYGITTEFWISLLLTLLFYLPGAIYSVIVVHQYFKG